MLATSSFGARGLVIGASALMHVAIFAVAGHGRAKSADDSLALVDVTTLAVDATTDHVTPEALADDHEAHSHAHSHTHPYPVSPDHDATPHDPSIVHTPFSPSSASFAADSPAEAPSVETAPASAAAPSFAMTIGNAPTAHGAVQTDGTGTGALAAPAHDDAPVAENGVSARARLVHGDLPAYTDAALSAEIQADVPLEIVVDKTGAVVSARATSHVGYGLDEAAIAAVRKYHFSPAARDGAPCAVRMAWTVQFHLN